MSADDVGVSTNSFTSKSGAQHFFARALHIFFGKPLRFLLPTFLITGYGFYAAVSAPDEYTSVGVFSVSSETFLGELSQVRTSPTSFETPATTTARQFNELMQTDAFVESLIEGVGLSSGPGPNSVDPAELRTRVYATPTGDTLLRITGVSEIPEEARLLANSGIVTFKNFVISSEVLGSDVAESFYDEQLATHAAEVDAASGALADFLAANPEPINSGDERDVADQIEIERLNDQLVRAQSRFDLAFDNREVASLATMQSAADIGQRFRVLDEPVTPVLPSSGLRAMLTTVILFGVLGLMISVGAVALACLADKSIHSAADLERIGVTVRAVVPRTKFGKHAVSNRLVAVSEPAVASDVPMRSAG